MFVHSRAKLCRKITLSFFVVFSGAQLAACGESEKTTIQAGAFDPHGQDALPADYKPNPKPRPQFGLPPPSEEELKAWDRSDPEGEKHLYKFDKSNLPRMLTYWRELECLRDKVKEEGEKAFGVAPGSPEFEQWEQFKQVFIPKADTWQKRLLANEPRILETSKLMSHFFQVHELIIHGYPKAYNNSDKVELEKADLEWTIVENKIAKYIRDLTGKPMETLDLSQKKDLKLREKICHRALNPPKNATAKRFNQGGKKRKVTRVEID